MEIFKRKGKSAFALPDELSFICKWGQHTGRVFIIFKEIDHLYVMLNVSWNLSVECPFVGLFFI